MMLDKFHPVFSAKPRSHRKGRFLSAKTVRHIGFLVNDALETGVRWGAIDVNPMNGVEGAKAVKRDVTVLDDEDLSRFFDGARCTRLYPVHRKCCCNWCEKRRDPSPAMGNYR